MNKTKKGFTLIELIVVLAILAVIAAIAVPTAFGSIEKAKQSADQATIDGYNSAIRMQATLLTANYDAGGDSIAKAIEEGGMKGSTATVQASNTVGKVFYVAPVNNNPGYFVIADKAPAGGTSITVSLDSKWSTTFDTLTNKITSKVTTP